MSAQWIENTPVPMSWDARIERETHKLEKRLCRQVGQAIIGYLLPPVAEDLQGCVIFFLSHRLSISPFGTVRAAYHLCTQCSGGGFNSEVHHPMR